jgi:hypothetical protein
MFVLFKTLYKDFIQDNLERSESLPELDSTERKRQNVFPSF